VGHKLTFDALIETFLLKKDLKPTSRTAYLSAFNQFAIFLKDRLIQDIGEQEILEYKEHLMSKNLSVFTVIANIRALKSLFSFLAVRGLYPNIAKDIKTPKSPRQFMRDPLTLEQARGLINSTEGDDIIAKRDYAIINTLLRCGLRSIEIVRADIGDVRQSGGTPVLWVHGKGRDSKDEFVVLTDEALAAIHSYMAVRGKVNLNDPLFVSHSNHNASGRLTTRSVRRLVKKHLKETGINSSRLTCHSLRHTFATLAIANNAPLLAVQQAMRHADINTTTIYTHMNDRLTNGAERYVKI
jgi:site-specific recombinase XerD